MLYFLPLFSQKSDREKKEKERKFTIYEPSDNINWQLLRLKFTTSYFYPNHIMTTATMSTIIIAFIIAAICQLGIMGEEEKVSNY
jgi:hypothetical protein